MNRKKIEKFIKISAGVLGTAFVVTSVVGKKKSAESKFENEPEQKNPLEGKKVVFVANEEEPENADGARGHLEATGNSTYQMGFYEKYIKRGIDIVLSFGGLVVLSPLLLGISLAIKIDDPGPVLFTQKRMGQNKKYFKLHKFRSMKMCTPHDVPTHMLDNPDQYITKVGKFLRAHSLDELPQIWDIFIGNMSVIGPRPGLWNQDILTAERDKYNANDVKPGLVVAIDDIDMNIESGFEILEKLQRYLKVERLIILIAVNYEQMKLCCEKHFSKVFDNNDIYGRNKRKEYVGSLADQYLEKVIPSYRVYTRDIFKRD